VLLNHDRRTARRSTQVLGNLRTAEEFRLIAALVLGAIAAALTMAGIFVTEEIIFRGSEISNDLIDFVIAFATVASVIAIPVTLAIGVPSYLMLKKYERLTLTSVVAVATIGTFATGSLFRHPVGWPATILGGIVAGIIIWSALPNYALERSRGAAS
jgi:hypothetical protein